MKGHWGTMGFKLLALRRWIRAASESENCKNGALVNAHPLFIFQKFITIRIIALLLIVMPGRNAAATPLSDVTFVAFDVETTGLSADQDRIIELGAVKYKNGKIIKSTSWLINPGRPIKNFFIHHITDDMVAGHPGFKEVFPAFCQFSAGCVLIAHNAPFDMRFISAELRRNCMSPPDEPVIDSLRLFRTWFPKAPSHSIGHLIRYFSLPDTTFHRAKNDAEYLLRIMEIGLKQRPNITLEQLKADAGGYLYFREK